MIEFIDIDNAAPYQKFEQLYQLALASSQENIEAICVSSFDHTLNTTDSRFVNLKFVKQKEFIFFTNLHSPKAIQFEKNPNTSISIFWNKVNTQIRMKGKIQKTDDLFCDEYFSNRSWKKNALAISSNQSNKINSFMEVEEKYAKIYNSNELIKRPFYWGGYSFIPCSVEFWEGHKARLNYRELYQKDKSLWAKSILEP